MRETSHKPTAAQRKSFAVRAFAALRRMGLSKAALARELKCHRNSVFLALYQGQCPDIHRRVSARLGINPIL